MVNATCQGCGAATFQHPRARQPKKWCSEACRVKTYRETNAEYRERSRMLNLQRYREQFVPSAHDLSCVVCSAEFVATRKDRKYCSQSCANRAYNERRRLDGRAAEIAASRRALERGAKIKGGKRLAILLADNYVCHLCGERTNVDAVYPDPAYPVIDHVVPLSKGGDHCPSNWRTAHNLCNSRRRDLSVSEFRERYL